ncbi:caspase family protein [Streptomyces sp. NPDC057705]|uniref:caspase, EACC1-associated type n=1 Tax=Streptomyces sp. NPDC057705 TaxID=3346222 RepID=UPI0036C73F55
MTSLSGPGVRVLLIATSTHHGPHLPSVPSVARTFEDLRTVFTERCGVREDRLRLLLDPPDARSMAEAVTEEAQRADTVLLVYFVGHGLLGPGGELHLAASGTDRLTPGMAGHQALSFTALRQALEVSRASSVVLVLDCCFSGRVSLGTSASVPALAVEPTHGVYFIGSAEQLADAPPDAEHTAFSGALIDVLTTGDPRGPHPLTLDAVYDAVFQNLRDQQRPWPRRQAGDRSGALVVAPNPARRAGQPPTQEPPAPGRCPYPGLEAFRVEDADVFFGRDRMTERVLAAVGSRAAASDRPALLVLVGASGSGKSSLLNAGLLARLRDGDLPGSAGWPCLRFTPGTSPLRRLAAQLAAVAPGGFAALGAHGPADAADLLREEPGRAADWIAGQAGEVRPDNAPPRQLVVLIDQLEELFTLCPAEEERSAFLKALTALAAPVDGSPPRTLMVLALRADFYGQAVTHPELRAALDGGQLLVEPMTPGELRATIEKPAAASGLLLDDGLADVILHEFGAAAHDRPEAGALPLLSHVLWATWEKRAGTRLTVAGYRAAGGISQAIAETAEGEYTALDEAGQEAVRRMLPRLVRVGTDTTDTARAADRSELLHGLPDAQAAQRAIDRFTTKARLLTADQDTVRISHEALLRAWPRLREWIDADRDWLRTGQQLADDAQAWERAAHDSSLLYRGNRLAAVRERAADAPTTAAALPPGPAAFMKASWRQERRGARRRKATAAFFTVLALLASLGLAGAVMFQRQASRAQERDLARYLASEAEGVRRDQPGLAKQLSLLAFRIDKGSGRGALSNSQQTPGVINDGETANVLAYSADGRALAITTANGIMLRGPSGPEAARIEVGRPGPLALDRGGRLLAALTYPFDRPKSLDATLRLWDISDLTRPVQIVELPVGEAGTALAISPDGRTAFTGADTGEVRRWDIGNRSAPKELSALTGHASRIDTLAAAPTGDLLASASLDGKVLLWDIREPSSPARLSELRTAELSKEAVLATGLLHRVDFDSSGRRLAVPTAPNPVNGMALWSLDDPRAPRQVAVTDLNRDAQPGRCGADSVKWLSLSPDGRQVVTKCGSRWQAWLSDAVPGARTGTLAVGASADSSSGAVAFDPGHADRFLDAGSEGIRVWNLPAVAEPAATAFLPGRLSGGAHIVYRSAGQKQLLAVNNLGSNALWDVTTPEKPALLLRKPAPAPYNGVAIALSPDGSLIAASEHHGGDEIGRLQLRSTSDPDGPPLAVLSGLDFGVRALAFSPTRPLLAVAVKGGKQEGQANPAIHIYDVSNPREPRETGRIEGNSSDIDFSADGQALTAIVALRDDREGRFQMQFSQRLQSWDLTDPVHPTELWMRPLPSSGWDATFAYRPDGSLLALHHTGVLRLWRVERHQLIGEPVTVNIGSDSGPLAFSPDGTRLALTARTRLGGSSETRPELWDLTDPDAPVRESMLPGDEYDGGAALAFSPDGQSIAVGRDWGVALWDTDPERIIPGLCATVGDPITRQQWKRYLPDRPYEPPCGTRP